MRFSSQIVGPEITFSLGSSLVPESLVNLTISGVTQMFSKDARVMPRGDSISSRGCLQQSFAARETNAQTESGRSLLCLHIAVIKAQITDKAELGAGLAFAPDRATRSSSLLPGVISSPFRDIIFFLLDIRCGGQVILTCESPCPQGGLPGWDGSTESP